MDIKIKTEIEHIGVKSILVETWADYELALIDSDEEAVCTVNSSTLPDFLTRGSGSLNGLRLEIDLKTGQIRNWKAPSEEDISEFFSDHS